MTILIRNDEKLTPEVRADLSAALNALEKLCPRSGIVTLEASSSFGDIDSIRIQKDFHP